MVSVPDSVQESAGPAEVRGAGQRPRRLKVAQEVAQDQQVVRESEFPETVAAQVAARGRLPREEVLA